MAPPAAPDASSANSVLYIHPSLKLVDLGKRGYGYVAGRGLRRGELLLEERPFVWDSGGDSARPELGPGAEWLLQTGAVHELPCPEHAYNTLRERAETVASLNAFRNQSPCADGSYPAMLFRASSRFNHDCYPNAGAYAPGGHMFPSVATSAPGSLSTFALDEIHKGEEVCISYLPDAEQLSPSRSRQGSLQGWGFQCQCNRCQGGRPLDRRLEGVSADVDEGSIDKQRLIRDANQDFRRLFDPTSDEYNPPKNDFQETVERLNHFRDRHKFLDRAHCAMQRVRRELIAAFLIDGPNGPIAQKFARAAAGLLVEELLVLNELLPSLSPCKVRPYALLLTTLKGVPPEEAVWLEREARTDGCDLWARNALWLHDPAEARRLGAAEPRNLPPRPPPGPPPRRGPEPGPGACCLPGLAAAAAAPRPPAAAAAARRRWPRRRAAPGRRPAAGAGGPPPGWAPTGAAAAERAEPPGGGEAEAEAEAEGGAGGAGAPAGPGPGGAPAAAPGPLGLWEAYGDYGRPSAAARGLRGLGGAAAGRGGEGGGSWFRFRK